MMTRIVPSFHPYLHPNQAQEKKDQMMRLELTDSMKKRNTAQNQKKEYHVSYLFKVLLTLLDDELDDILRNQVVPTEKKMGDNDVDDVDVAGQSEEDDDENEDGFIVGRMKKETFKAITVPDLGTGEIKYRFKVSF